VQTQLKYQREGNRRLPAEFNKGREVKTRMKRSGTFSRNLVVLCVICAIVATLCGVEAAKAQKSRRPEVSASARQTVPGESEWVNATLRSLSLRERIGQLIVTAASSEYMNLSGDRFAEVKRQIEQNRVGGIIIRGGSPNDVAALTNEMQRISRLPLLIAADYERGLRMQMKNGTPFTTNMGVAAAGDPQAAYLQGKIIAQEMRAMGVNWLYAPVADINNNPDNPVINIRSFGEDPARVAAFVAAEVRGVRDGGALATVKHFPGHGDTATDSHIGLATIKVKRKRLDEVELIPFKAAIAAGVDSVMTAHVAVPEVTGDNMPSTLSPKITTDLLRRELGFNGIVVTDSLGMGAITKGFPGGEAAVRAIKAGADVALLTPDPKLAIDALEQAVKKGELTESRIDESVRRLLHAKYRLGLVKQRFVDPQAVNRLVEEPGNLREAQRVAERAITLLRNEGNVLPLDAGRADRALFVVIAADDDEEEGRTFVPEVQRRAKNAYVIKADPRTTAREYDELLAQAAKAETIIIAPFVKRAALKGTVALPDAQADFVRKLVATGKPVAVIGFGSPYLVRQFDRVPVYATAYAIEDVAQAAGVRALFGEVPIQGRLPVRVPGMFELGAGIQLDARAQERVGN
jgi:beta-N-acetylhexosaminidase